MEPPAVERSKRPRDHKQCEHCGEELSYSAYLQRRRLYYIASERRWVQQIDSTPAMLPDNSKRPRIQSVSVNDEEEATESQIHESSHSPDVLGGNEGYHVQLYMIHFGIWHTQIYEVMMMLMMCLLKVCLYM